jgi:TPR repeat protein
LGVPKDEAEAARWYRKAADQGLAEAEAHLGGCYALGRGVPKDEAEAGRWLRRVLENPTASSELKSIATSLLQLLEKK